MPNRVALSLHHTKQIDRQYESLAISLNTNPQSTSSHLLIRTETMIYSCRSFYVLGWKSREVPQGAEPLHDSAQ
jgi:hypothetical protein